jgi:capsule polysaccharide export protein KpsC/LpsZ
MLTREETTELFKKGTLLKTLQKNLRMQKSPFDQVFRGLQVAYANFMRVREGKGEDAKQVYENLQTIGAVTSELRVALYKVEMAIQQVKENLPEPTKEEEKMLSKKDRQINRRMVNPFYGRNVKF